MERSGRSFKRRHSSSHSTSDESDSPCLPRRSRKANCCLYCGKCFQQISTHLKTVHSKEIEMRALEKLSEPRKRKIAFRELVSKGNSKHNQKQMEDADSEAEKNLIPAYKHALSKRTVKYVECSKCKRLYGSRTIRRHACAKEYKKSLNPGEKFNIKRFLQKENPNPPPHGLEPIFNSLQDDKTADIIKTDRTIIGFAQMKMIGVSGATDLNRQEKINHLRAKLRAIGAFLQVHRKVSKDKNLSLKTVLKKRKYSTKLPEIMKEYSKNYTRPDALEKLGVHLGAIMEYLKCESSSVKGFTQWEIRAQKFKMTWKNCIRPRIFTSQLDKSLRKQVVIPEATSIQRVHDFLEQRMTVFVEKKSTSYSYPEYLDFCRCIIARITMYNFRRANEVARMTLEQFESRTSGSEAVMTIAADLKGIEKQIAQFMESVVLKGKSRRHEVVMAMLLPDMVRGIEKLLKVRKKFKTLEQNKFLFATKGNLSFYVNGGKAIHRMVGMAGIKDPSTITATILRKYVATSMLWMKLSDAQRELMYRHFGHTKAVHQRVYRNNLSENTGRYCVIPAFLLGMHAGITPENMEDMTNEEASKYIEKVLKATSKNQTLDQQHRSDSSDENNSVEFTDFPKESENLPRPEPSYAQPSTSGIRSSRCQYSSSSNSSEVTHEDVNASESEELPELKPANIKPSTSRACTSSRSSKSSSFSLDEVMLEDVNASGSSSNSSTSPSAENENSGSLRTGMARWTPKMLEIVEEVFKEELKAANTPIRKPKLLVCQQRFKKECQRLSTISAIRANVWTIRKKRTL